MWRGCVARLCGGCSFTSRQIRPIWEMERTLPSLNATCDVGVDDSRRRGRDSDVTHHLPQEMSLRDVVFNYPAIDNHAHPLLKEECRRNLPFEGVISEAQPDAVKDAIHSLPGYRAARQLAELYGLDPDAGWEEIKNHRDGLEYDRLCNMSMQQLGIQCLLLDDGLRGVQEMANDLSWHRRFANNSVYRLVRIEPVAEVGGSRVSQRSSQALTV